MYDLHMAMTHRVSVKLDAKSEAALYRIMQQNGRTKSQALLEAVWAVIESEGFVRRPKQPPRKQKS
jgi:hypothetical protein